MPPESLEIVAFEDVHRQAFERLNLEWIREHDFSVEEIDRQHLQDPRNVILDPGGRILIALRGPEVVGSCALVNRGSGDYELAKITVAKSARNSGLGGRLMRAAIDGARELGAARIVLLSNSRLRDAIRLFERFGFTDVPIPETEYEQVDVAMALELAGAPGRGRAGGVP